eukprot:m.86758 g.86758  ORF g.86758 m.86758 type:complete len:127 (-) comp8291_c0_seq5:55-435(-)
MPVVVGDHCSHRSKFDGQTTAVYVNTTVQEAVRVAGGKPILPYTWYLYNAYPRPAPGAWTALSAADWTTVVTVARTAGASGLVLWGGIDGTTFFEPQLASHLNTTMGPVIAKAWDSNCGVTPKTVA